MGWGQSELPEFGYLSIFDLQNSAKKTQNIHGVFSTKKTDPGYLRVFFFAFWKKYANTA